MGNLFGSEMTLKEIIKEQKRINNKSIRELEREMKKINREEKKINKEMRKLAKEGQMKAVKIMATGFCQPFPWHADFWDCLIKRFRLHVSTFSLNCIRAITTVVCKLVAANPRFDYCTHMLDFMDTIVNNIRNFTYDEISVFCVMFTQHDDLLLKLYKHTFWTDYDRGLFYWVTSKGQNLNIPMTAIADIMQAFTRIHKGVKECLIRSQFDCKFAPNAGDCVTTLMSGSSNRRLVDDTHTEDDVEFRPISELK